MKNIIGYTAIGVFTILMSVAYLHGSFDEPEYIEVTEIETVSHTHDGEELFHKHCAVCHVLGQQHVGPDLLVSDLPIDKVMNGGGGMPAMGWIGEDKVEAIFDYIEDLQK